MGIGAAGIAAIIGAVAAVGGTAVAHQSRQDTKKATSRAEARALQETQKSEALAAEKKKKADIKLEEQRARILKGQKGRGGLLFGSEKGVEEETKAQTLGE